MVKHDGRVVVFTAGGANRVKATKFTMGLVVLFYTFVAD